MKDEKPKDEEVQEEEEPDVSAFRPARCTYSKAHSSHHVDYFSPLDMLVKPSCHREHSRFAHAHMHHHRCLTPCSLCCSDYPPPWLRPGDSAWASSLDRTARSGAGADRVAHSGEPSRICDDDDGDDYDHGDACHLLCYGLRLDCYAALRT